MFESIVGIVRSLGYPGVALLTLLENVVPPIPFPPFLAYTLVGTAAWTAALTWAGVLLGRNHRAVESYPGPTSWVVIGGIVGWYVYKVVTCEAAEDGRS